MNPFDPHKIWQHGERIKEWQQTGTCPPVTVEFDLTNACDNFCPWCFGYSGLDRTDKTTWNVDNVGQHWKKADALDTIDQLCGLGAKGIIFTGGGEPLVSPHIVACVQFAAQIGLDVGLITNGNRFDPEKARAILRYLTWIRFSVDACDKEEYAREHGVKSWETLLLNIRNAVEVKRLGELGVTIGIGYLTSGHNDDRIPPFARLGKSLGVDYAQFRPFHLTSQHPDPDFTQATVARIRDAQAKYSTPDFDVACSEWKYGRIAANKVKREYHTCCGHHFATVVGADHKMYVCCHMRGIEKYCIGDLRKQTVKEIWHGERRANIDASIDVHSSDCPPLCRADNFNTDLYAIARPPAHKNFL